MVQIISLFLYQSGKLNRKELKQNRQHLTIMTQITHDFGRLGGEDSSHIFKDPRSEEAKETLNSLRIKHKAWMHNGRAFDVFRYDKQFMTRDSYKDEGRVRSVISRNGKIVSVAPGKSIDLGTFKSELGSEDEVSIEEFVDGVMVNMFWDEEEEEWEIATRSSVGGRVSFFTTGAFNTPTTFRYMFLECINETEMIEGVKTPWMDNLDRSVCYSFVLRHPRHRIVSPVDKPGLALVDMYRIDKENPLVVHQLPLTDEAAAGVPDTVTRPMNLAFGTPSTDIARLEEQYNGGGMNWSLVGVMLRNRTTGVRSKIRNPNYEDVRKLRGNQPKLQFHYLSLRCQRGLIARYLGIFSEHRELFNHYKEQVFRFTHELFNHYRSAFIRKEVKPADIPFQYRSHAFELHKIYREQLAARKAYVDKKQVIEYVNSLPPARLMHSLNWALRDEALATGGEASAESSYSASPPSEEEVVISL